jgi:AbrB family looped-hinge helix DNA binding protein
MEQPEGKKFYGSVTVSERGQIVIPVDARRDFGIKTGDKLLVFGDLERGLGIATFGIMQRTMEGARDLFREVGMTMNHKEPKAGDSNNK